MSPTMVGRMPESTLFTPAYFRRFLMSAAMMRMMTKEGRMTPSVATSAPKKPACAEPMKVAILTASGPGVDSATAMKLRNSSSVSQAFSSTVSRMSEIMPYPPPKDTAPIFRKVRKRVR